MSRTSIAGPSADLSVSSISVRETVVVTPRSANADAPASTSFALCCASISTPSVVRWTQPLDEPPADDLPTGSAYEQTWRKRLPPRRALLNEPAAGFLHDLAVELEAAAAAQVLDDVPVHLADVLAADFRQAVSQRKMDRPVDLLVEERVLHVLRDARVAADAELAERARAVVAVEGLDQELLVVIGRGVDDAPFLEAEPDSGHLAAGVDGRKLREGDRSGGRVLEGRVEELPARHVGATGVHLALASFEAEREVRPLGDDLHLARVVEVLGVVAHPLALGVPVEQAGTVEEVLEAAQRHPRFLRKRRRRVLAADPLQLEGEDALDVRPDAGLEAAQTLLV